MYPLAVDAAGEDATYVGRIREDDTIPNGLNMWIVADNIRKGAALNAVQIAEKLVIRDLLGVSDRTVLNKKLVRCRRCGPSDWGIGATGGPNLVFSP